ncbi:transposase [Actinomycetospora sp. NBRC 106375]|nr:transposase [Actinomycetospora sp. NBRC 106375]
MAPPRKFDAETRARAVRMYEDRLRDHGDSKLAARRHVGAILDVNPATLRNWVEGERPRSDGTGHDAEGDQVDLEEFRRLQKEVAELRRANEILKTASAFFAQAELDRKLR